jgi:hypothetical protein
MDGPDILSRNASSKSSLMEKQTLFLSGKGGRYRVTPGDEGGTEPSSPITLAMSVALGPSGSPVRKEIR